MLHMLKACSKRHSRQYPIVWWCLLLLMGPDSSGVQAACCVFAGAHSRETMWSGDWAATTSFSASN